MRFERQMHVTFSNQDGDIGVACRKLLLDPSSGSVQTLLG
jgi:hypothetical protein